MRRNEMRVRSLLVLGIVLLFGSAAFAQDYAKVEIPLDYSYMRFNPENSHIISGGINIPLSKPISIRPAQFDLVLTRFGSAFTAGNNNQSNFRYNGGIVFRF